jgi:tol-pal system protein YbgF
MRMKLSVLALLLTIAAGPAFSQNKELLQLQADMITLQQQVRQLQSGVDASNAATKGLAGLIEKITDQVNTVAGSVQKVSQAVDGVKAQNDTNIKEMRTILTNLNSAIGELQEGLTSVRAQVNSVSQQVTTINTKAEVLPGPNDLLKNAMSEFFSGLYDLAVMDYQDFLTKYPNDPHARDAHLRMGEALSNLKKYDQAEAEFDLVLQKYPDSDTSRAALLKKGLALAEHDKPQAITTLKEVVSKFPNTSESSTAQDKLRELQPPRRPPAR